MRKSTRHYAAALSGRYRWLARLHPLFLASACALLASLHNGSRFIAIGLAVVMSIQLYFLSASWVSP